VPNNNAGTSLRSLPAPVVKKQYLDPPPAADQQIGGQQVDLSPYVGPTVDSKAFNPSAAIALPANGAANRATILAYTMPTGYAGVMLKLALVVIGGGFTEFSGNVVFRLFRNQTAVEGYENIQFQIGSLATPADTDIKLWPGQTLYAYVETYGGAPTGQAAALFYGRKWPFTRQQSALTQGLQ
jgi:hypothetical protein